MLNINMSPRSPSTQFQKTANKRPDSSVTATKVSCTQGNAQVSHQSNLPCLAFFVKWHNTLSFFEGTIQKNNKASRCFWSKCQKQRCENKFPALRYCSAFLCCSSRKSSLVRILKWMRDEWCFLSAVFDQLTEKQIRISWSTAYVSGK